MTDFQSWPARSDPKFAPGTYPDLLTPTLTIEVRESEMIALQNEPEGLQLRVWPVEQDIASVELAWEIPSRAIRVFRITAKAHGTTLIEARMPDQNRSPATEPRIPSNGFIILGLPGAALANLRVNVTDKDWVEPNSDFVGGFRAGISKYSSQAVKTLEAKILVAIMLPLGVTSLQTAASGGVIRGLTDGLISFRDLLKGVASVAAGAARYTWDAKFRDEVQTKGGAMIGPWLDLIFYWGSANRQRAVYMAFMRNGKAIGTIVGEEIGREISDQIAKKSVAEIFEWVGYIIGRVYFEILLLVAFEGFGAAVRAVRSGGEGARIAARLWPRIERLLDGLNDVKNFLRARIAARAAEGGRDVVGLLRPYVNLNRAAETLKFEAPLGAWLDELAQRSQLGAVRRVRGMPEFPGPGGNPDYHLFLRNLDNTELANEALAADLRGDAVIAEGNKIDNIINNAVGSKAGRQADAVFIEIGSKGTSGEITDEAVKAWNVDHVRPMSPSLRRLMVVRNTGGARQILIDLLIR